MQPVTSTTSTSTTTTTPAVAVAVRKAHPVRGILWGLLMGLGATVLAIVLKIIPLDLVWVAIVLAGGILLGILWSTLGPAKQPHGDPPWRATDQVTNRTDWDAGPVPPLPPTPPGVEPLHIRPLDVEPVDIDPPAVSDVPAETVTTSLPGPVEPAVDPVLDPPRTLAPPQPEPPPLPPPR